ncbi:MAG: ABC transporter substrate-binding protein [Deltaproteobacteria bacterium]|nr:ABC transporter substrate-binding protein [Deltaproteobacteria bacterium]
MTRGTLVFLLLAALFFSSAALSPPLSGEEAAAPSGGLPAESPPAAAEGALPAILFTAPGDGDFAAFGRSAVLGARLAHRVYGGGFELVVENEGGGPLFNRVSRFGRVKAAAGHLFEGSLEENAPYYQRYEIPVLLPFLDNWRTADLGGGFYQMMPSVPAQAEILAERTLKGSGKLSRIVILETPAPPFALLASTYAATLKDPSALRRGKQKAPRKLGAKIPVQRYVLRDLRELPLIVAENKMGPRDVVLLALSQTQAVQAAPYFMESNFQKTAFLAPSSLAVRDVARAFLAANLTLEVVVPYDMRDTKNAAFNEFVHRFRILNKAEPAWPSLAAYDAVTMAIKVGSVPEGERYLTTGERGPEGLSGFYSFSDGLVPGRVATVTKDSAVYYP